MAASSAHPRHSWARAALAVGLGLSLLAAAGTVLEAAQQAELRDDQGVVFPPGPPPRRIVSLAPSITEILFDLGLGPEVVGDTRYCDYPAEATKKPRIGGMLDPDLEKIRALDPDLVIAFRGNPLPVIRRMRDLGLRVFVLEEGQTVASLFPFLDKIGRVTQRSAEAAALIARLKARYRRLERALGPLPDRPRVFLAIHGLGFWTSGRSSYLTDLVAQAGGTSIAAAAEKRWVEYSPEQLLEARPDVFVLLVTSSADFERARSWLMGQASLRSLPAIRDGRLHPLDEDEASRFGPRLIDVLEDLARILHPGIAAGKS